MRENNRGDQLRMKLWYRGKDVLINKIFDLTHEEIVQKTTEAITPITDTVKLYPSNIPLGVHRGSTKNDPEFGIGDLTNSRNLIELL